MGIRDGNLDAGRLGNVEARRLGNINAARQAAMVRDAKQLGVDPVRPSHCPVTAETTACKGSDRHRLRASRKHRGPNETDRAIGWRPESI